MIYTMVVIASSALYLVIKSFAGYGRQRVVFSLAILSGFIPPLAFQIRNHPNQYVYYNGLVGRLHPRRACPGEQDLHRLVWG